eukprot:364586-Chlamydomonas_euryale.AAC.8
MAAGAVHSHGELDGRSFASRDACGGVRVTSEAACSAAPSRSGPCAHGHFGIPIPCRPRRHGASVAAPGGCCRRAPAASGFLLRLRPPPPLPHRDGASAPPRTLHPLPRGEQSPRALQRAHALPVQSPDRQRALRRAATCRALTRR